MFCNTDKNITYEDHQELRGIVKSLVKEKRFIHTLGVEEEAVEISKIYGFGEKFIDKLRSAAILHDITKEFSYQKQLEICEKYNIKLSGDDKKTEKSIHAKTGAYVAELEFGADDTVFGAIYRHTFGAAGKNFTLFDKIIYLADYIEPNRTFEDCAEVRMFFYSRLENAETFEQKLVVMDETILFSYNKTIEALIKDNLFIHGDTIKCRNALIYNG